MESYEILWETTLTELEKTVSHISFDTYVSQLQAVDIVENRIILITQSKLFSETIQDKMREKIRDALKKSNQNITDFVIYVAKDKEDYLRLLYSNPCGFKLTARLTTNYRCLKTIYSQRKNHRLPEWREFCKWIETLPYSELITGKECAE